MKTIVSCLIKRELLQVVGSIFDPLGWIYRFALRGKIILQYLLKQRYDWDQEVDRCFWKHIAEWTEEFAQRLLKWM